MLSHKCDKHIKRNGRKAAIDFCCEKIIECQRHTIFNTRKVFSAPIVEADKLIILCKGKIKLNGLRSDFSAMKQSFP